MDIDWTGVYINPHTLALAPNGFDIPTYGNYGGPYHTGGDVAPIDPLDAVFQIHDNTPASIKSDHDLLNGIVALTDAEMDPEAHLYAGLAEFSGNSRARDIISR